MFNNIIILFKTIIILSLNNNYKYYKLYFCFRYYIINILKYFKINKKQCLYFIKILLKIFKDFYLFDNEILYIINYLLYNYKLFNKKGIFKIIYKIIQINFINNYDILNIEKIFINFINIQSIIKLIRIHNIIANNIIKFILFKYEYNNIIIKYYFYIINIFIIKIKNNVITKENLNKILNKITFLIIICNNNKNKYIYKYCLKIFKHTNKNVNLKIKENQIISFTESINTNVIINNIFVILNILNKNKIIKLSKKNFYKIIKLFLILINNSISLFILKKIFNKIILLKNNNIKKTNIIKSIKIKYYNKNLIKLYKLLIKHLNIKFFYNILYKSNIKFIYFVKIFIKIYQSNIYIFNIPIKYKIIFKIKYKNELLLDFNLILYYLLIRDFYKIIIILKNIIKNNLKYNINYLKNLLYFLLKFSKINYYYQNKEFQILLKIVQFILK